MLTNIKILNNNEAVIRGYFRDLKYENEEYGKCFVLEFDDIFSDDVLESIETFLEVYAKEYDAELLDWETV